jgi:hypothetical protein
MRFNEIKPPQALSNLTNTIKMFLAGSIEMGVAEDWQTKVSLELEQRIHGHVSITIINPRREEWDNSWTQSIESPQFYQQVNWELNGLDKADYILMYFSPETKSPISLLELGLYAASGKLIVCCPEGFWRKGNVDIVCEKYGIQTVDTLDELINVIVNKINR